MAAATPVPQVFETWWVEIMRQPVISFDMKKKKKITDDRFVELLFVDKKTV